ncbi:MAG: GTPase Era [Firmicutes bacterium HGW-Firmicutes-2]|nr:MAG: GTPase Era [Firmicutes bacterium HGW-Firmicutes-3]PKM67114.1 MAG: GTPase Era [Firmicutes bacterium HGW-Firmicutes-2]
MNNKKSGFVTIIGRPNVGKSTLMNHLIGQKIAIMSDKPQTTRNRIQTILTNDLGQIVFIDTPGIHVPMTKLGEFMNTSAETTLNEVDAVLWLIEPDKKIGKGDRYIIERLARVETPVFLVINKMDTIAKNELLEVIATYKDQYSFKDIIPISALKGENTDILLDRIFDVLEDGPMYFPEDMVTDQPERQICAELIREKVLLNMEQEIPHGVAVVIDQMKERESQAIIDIDATIVCEKDSHKGMVIGKQGAMLKKIGSMARRDMENLLGSKVNLKIWVRVKKDWRDSDYLLKNYGYTNKE